jgi:uncharacterized protein YwgA
MNPKWNVADEKRMSASDKEKMLALGGILRRIGNFGSSCFPSSFDMRLTLQKTVYLMQAFGLYIGFDFSWYLRGPYSPMLAHLGYEIAKMENSVPLAKFSNPESEKRFEEFLEFLGPEKDNVEWLEILASIHMQKKLHPWKHKSDILEIVVHKQSYFTIEECREAWIYLARHGLIGDEE